MGSSATAAGSSAVTTAATSRVTSPSPPRSTWTSATVSANRRQMTGARSMTRATIGSRRSITTRITDSPTIIEVTAARMRGAPSRSCQSDSGERHDADDEGEQQRREDVLPDPERGEGREHGEDEGGPARDGRAQHGLIELPRDLLWSRRERAPGGIGSGDGPPAVGRRGAPRDLAGTPISPERLTPPATERMSDGRAQKPRRSPPCPGRPSGAHAGASSHPDPRRGRPPAPSLRSPGRVLVRDGSETMRSSEEDRRRAQVAGSPMDRFPSNNGHAEGGRAPRGRPHGPHSMAGSSSSCSSVISM